MARSADQAMRHTAVWAAVRLRADLLGSLPVDVFERQKDGSTKPVDPPQILTHPSADARIDEFLTMACVSQDLRGNAVGEIVKWDDYGRPEQIELWHPDEWSLRRDPVTGALVEAWFGGKQVPIARVWIARAYRIAGLPWGLSPIAYAANTISAGLSAQEFGLDWFGDGVHPSAVLETDQTIDEEQATTLKKRITGRLRGTREPIVLGRGLTWKPIRVAASESQFLEAQRASGADIARMFGLPPERLGYAAEGKSLTYANRESAALDFRVFSFGHTLRRWNAELSAFLPPNQFARLNAGALLQTELLARYRAHAMGISAKFLHPEEARAMEDLPPLTPEQAADLAALDVKAPEGGATDKTGGR